MVRMGLINIREMRLRLAKIIGFNIPAPVDNKKHHDLMMQSKLMQKSLTLSLD
jgi:hypothetical protein